MHHGRRVGASGILETTEAFTGVSPLMQTRSWIAPGAPVFQHPVETIWFGVRRPAKPSNRGWVALEPLSEEEARGVPPERIFEIRTEDGGPVDTTMIVLELPVIPAGTDLSVAREQYGSVGNSREMWLVMFAVASPPPNERAG